MNRKYCLLACVVLAPCAVAGADAGYRKLVLNERFYSEGANVGDFNHDGQIDVVAGPYWYEGPDFRQRHEIFPAVEFDPHKYSDAFFSFVQDFNGDGWPDVLVIGFPGREANWYQNPGKTGGAWQKHAVLAHVDNESPVVGDLLADGSPVLLCFSGGRIGYARAEPGKPDQPWTFHPISPAGAWKQFTHGLGYGDLNGDGRPDIIEKSGWWEQPASLAGDPIWKRHEFPFAPGRGGAQMAVVDVNGDGLPDVVTSRDAHGYGLSWFEQTRSSGGELSFVEHPILSEKPDEKIAGVQFSQAHALAIADIDGDGIPDIITGKRWWAHGPEGDVDPGGTPVLYAFLVRRGPHHSVTIEPRLLDTASGVGTQVVATDINGDGRADIIIGNKRGTFVFLSAPAESVK